MPPLFSPDPFRFLVWPRFCKGTHALTIQLTQQQSIEHIRFLGQYISNDAIEMFFFFIIQ